MNPSPATTSLASESVRPAGDSQRRYMPQLDGLRAFAMAGVLYVHFWGNALPGVEDLRVNLFFMLSGFLITRILLTARSENRGYTAWAFLARRSLRLLPPLYIALTIAWYFNMHAMRSSYLWHVFQMSNVYFMRIGEWKPWVTAHLWSLNIVEQFYMLWLAAFLFLPRKWILPAAVLMAACALPYRLFLFPESFAQRIGPFAFGDVIGLGCMIALYENWKKGLPRLPYQEWIALAAVVLLASPALTPFIHHEIFRNLSPLLLLIVVYSASAGLKGPMGWVLANPPIRYIGKISFGVFVYHFFILWFLMKYLPDWHWLELGPKRFVFAGGLTMICGALSWHFIEQPIASLKRFVPLVPGKRPIAVQPAAEATASVQI